ncbi:MAG: 30S ribosomal protein S4 [Saprospiraceae bacterium]|nr:30S ribosomal protein S4 [Saprospiraceae bacterium]
MARYTGPKTKKARALGSPIYGFDKNYERRKYGPGQHGNARRRQRSEYAIQLQEKQKAKYTYGVLERQFRNLFEEANRRTGITGEVLLQLLESRLDNVVYRLGFSNSRRGARQLVSHKHVTVNGQILSIPSYQVKTGDVIGLRDKTKVNPQVEDSVNKRTDYSWLAWDASEMKGTFNELPSRELIPENINEQLIVELYSK